MEKVHHKQEQNERFSNKRHFSHYSVTQVLLINNALWCFSESTSNHTKLCTASTLKV